MAKKKNKVKTTILIITTILGSLFGVSYATVPEFQDVVNDKVVDVVKKNVPFLERTSLEELKPVTNIKFDEDTGMLIFDESPGAKGYIVNVRYHDHGYRLESDTNQVKIRLSNILNGDTVTFEVIAEGDYVKTKNSKGVEFSHTMQFVNDTYYVLSKSLLDNIMSVAPRTFNGFRTTFFEARSFDVQGEYFVIEGVGKSGSGRPVNFSIKYDMTEYKKSNSADFTNLSNYLNFLNYFRNNKRMITTAEYADGFIDMTNLLESHGVFSEYTDLGYKVEALQYSNSGIYSLDGESYVESTGIYKATHENLPSVTFKQANKISIETDDHYYAVEDFILDAEDLGIITEGEKEIYDRVLSDHFDKTIVADGSKVKSISSEKTKE